MAIKTKKHAGPGSKQPEQPSDDAVFLTPAQVARILNVKERFVWTAFAEGYLKKSKVGSYTRVHRDDLAAFMEKARG